MHDDILRVDVSHVDGTTWLMVAGEIDANSAPILPQMLISTVHAGGAALVRFTGELDAHVEPECIDAVNAAVSSKTPDVSRLTLDIDGLTLFGSSGVRLLLLARESAIERGVQFNVAPTSNKSVRRILDMFELTSEVLFASSARRHDGPDAS